MKRSEFLLRLAIENKFAVVSEDLQVVQLSNNSPAVISEEPLSLVCDPHDVNMSEFDTYSLSDIDHTVLHTTPLIERPISDFGASEQLEIISDSSGPNTSEEYLRGTLEFEAVNVISSDMDAFSESDQTHLKKTPLTRIPIPKSTACGDISMEVDVIDVPNTFNPAIPQELWPRSFRSQVINVSGSDKFTLPELDPITKNKIDLLETTLIHPETTACVESISEHGNMADDEHMVSILKNVPLNDTYTAKSNRSLDLSTIIIPNSVSDDDDRMDTSFVRNATDSERNVDNSNSYTFQECQSTGHEFIPIEQPAPSIVSASSSGKETDSRKWSPDAEVLGYLELTKVGEVKKTYSRGNSKLLGCKEQEKPVISDSNDVEVDKNKPSTSKNAVELGQKNCFNSNGYISSGKTIPKPAAINEDFTTQIASTSDASHQYIKKPSARERPTICPICYQDVITHFTRHLFRHHENNENVKLIKGLKPGSKERLGLVAALRKQGYFHLSTEKDVLNPVRTSIDPNTKYFICTYCLGHYNKKLLYKHVKHCKNKPADAVNPGKYCLSRSQTFMASILSRNHEYLRTSRIKREVFEIMRPDDISAVAKSDPLICLYGETLLAKHKRQQIAIVVSSRIREMARLLMALKSMNNCIHGLFDALRPDMFRAMISAAQFISGYDENKKNFKSPSLALHMGTNLKIVCNVAFKIVVEKRDLPNISWDNREQKKSDIKDLRKLIEGHWCNEISSLALKTLKERQWEKPVELPLANDLLAFQAYANNLAETAYENLENDIDTQKSYKILTECVLAQTVMFNRKRVGDVQYLKIETYNRDHCRIDQEVFTESLTAVEKLISKQFKRVVTGGKGSRPVPILFSRRMQKYIACLLKIRETTDIVPKSNSYMFANPGSENKWMAGASIISRLAKNCGAKQPSLLTSTKCRKHIATTLQLMSMQPEEMEQIATFMGHTKKTHAEFYRLPQDIFQTAKVAKVLLLLEKGKGKEFQGKCLNEIVLDKNIYYSSESDQDEDLNDIPLSEKMLHRINTINQTNQIPNNESVFENNKKRKMEESTDLLQEVLNLKTRELIKEQANGEREIKEEKEIELLNEPSGSKKTSRRIRWTDDEKKIVLDHFELHLKNKITPRKHECNQCLEKYGNILIDKDWLKIKTFVYNSFKNK